jgi:hypothetical protein
LKEAYKRGIPPALVYKRAFVICFLKQVDQTCLQLDEPPTRKFAMAEVVRFMQGIKEVLLGVQAALWRAAAKTAKQGCTGNSVRPLLHF